MYVIKNGTLYTMDQQGVIQADLRIENGKITAIGQNLPVDGAQVIDAAGKCVTPGFVDPHSHIGGFGGNGEQDLNEMSNPLTPEMDAYHGIDPFSDDFAVAIRQGITTSCLAPGSANVVGGWVFAYKSAGFLVIADNLALQRHGQLIDQGSVHKFGFGGMETSFGQLIRRFVTGNDAHIIGRDNVGFICDGHSE